MSQSSRSSSRRPGAAPAPGISVVRTAVAAGLVVLGIAWIVVYQSVARGGSSLTWMGDLTRWNYLIGFLLIFVGLGVAANPGTPLGRGRGVVVGMLTCFGLGLLWIVVYYVAGQTASIPVISDLGQYNLLVGIGFMATGFVYATRWE